MNDAVRQGLLRSNPASALVMRHTHLTLLLSLNVPIKVVSERAGHTGIQIALDTYAHVLPHMQAAIAEQLDRAFITR